MRLALGALLILWAPAAVLAKAPAKPELVLYAYDSFVAEEGPGPAIFPGFEKLCGCKVLALPVGDSGQLLTRLQLDARAGRHPAQLVVGLDQLLWRRASPWVERWGGWKPRGFARLRPEARGLGDGFLPFDVGYFAWMVDGKALAALGKKEPASIEELFRPEWTRRLLLEDPRTSTPGMAWLLFGDRWAREHGMNPAEFWQRFRTRWLTLAPGWDGAYGLFLKGEAPLVWSYTTSQAYHAEHGAEPGRYHALALREGFPAQVEGAAIIQGSVAGNAAALARARLFLEYLLSEPVQAKIARHNWMYPARADVAPPESFRKLPQPSPRAVELERDPAKIEAALREWSSAVEGRSDP